MAAWLYHWMGKPLTVIRLINQAKDKGYWLILAGHEMDEEYRDGTQISILKLLKKFVNML